MKGNIVNEDRRNPDQYKLNLTTKTFFVDEVGEKFSSLEEAIEDIQARAIGQLIGKNSDESMDLRTIALIRDFIVSHKKEILEILTKKIDIRVDGSPPKGTP